METRIWMAQKTATASALEFDGIIDRAFVMAHTVGKAYCVEGYEPGQSIRTAPVVRIGSLIGYDFIETQDGKRFLICTHENETAKASLEQIRRWIELNAEFFASLPLFNPTTPSLP
ncbi:hypothetical protein [Pseudomonas sp. 2FE]|uniref:hypothetical protein n=1 Tax=Pseudomonas sp. 2FE TaxID=2502190 RepID=UPI0010F5F262|nr:hypothetical protein [Pseudomonas sp. 2FE]